ncbi:MAG: hypothetical protein Q9M89_09080 [Persephonella sp.]|nr:hypothetical protein [Persephonella sp.]
MIKEKTKAPNKSLESQSTNLLFIFPGIDKITASWVCLSPENGGIVAVQPRGARFEMCLTGEEYRKWR